MEPVERGFSELVWKASPLSLPRLAHVSSRPGSGLQRCPWQWGPFTQMRISTTGAL